MGPTAAKPVMACDDANLQEASQVLDHLDSEGE